MRAYGLEARELLASCSKDQYVLRSENCFNSSIGGHIRHILDHYECFFQGSVNFVVDYDSRSRDWRVEKDPKWATASISACQENLNQLEQAEDSPVHVKMDTGSSPDELLAGSTFSRELQFLLSHTIHHYALIAVICSLAGTQVPVDFGIAPSTLAYRKSLRV